MIFPITATKSKKGKAGLKARQELPNKAAEDEEHGPHELTSPQSNGHSVLGGLQTALGEPEAFRANCSIHTYNHTMYARANIQTYNVR